VKGLRITGNTYVRDFVTESDQVQTELDAFIKGIKQAGPYRYLPDGICEADVEVTVQNVIKELKTIRQRTITYFPQQSVYREMQFEKILDWGPPKVIRASGNAVVPSRGYRQGASAETGASSVDAGETGGTVSTEVIRVTGTGVMKEGENGRIALLNAARAAEADARRKLAEKVYGVQIDATTTVRDYVTVNDQVEAKLSQFMAGARPVGEPRILSDGSVEITMELPLSGLKEAVGSSSAQ
jgi:hypothetical protein